MLFTALIVGGVGSNLGPVVGAVLVPVVLAEGSRYLPQFGPPTLVPSLEWIVIGVVLLAFLWFWPRGIVPERKRTFPSGARVPATHTQTTRGLAVKDLDERKRPEPVNADRLLDAPRAPLLSVRGISCSFGGVRAVDGRQLLSARWADHRPDRAERRGQVHDARYRGRRHPAVGGHHPIRRTRHHQAAQSPAGPARDDPDLPDAGRVRSAHRLENLLVAAPGQRGEKIRSIYSVRRTWRQQQRELVDQARDLLDRFGILRPRERVCRGTERRPAPADGARARAHGQATIAAAGRADGGGEPGDA